MATKKKLSDPTSIGTVGTNEVTTVTVDATGGNWTYTVAGDTTASNAWNISAAALVTAIEATTGVTAGDITVTGGPGDSGGTTPYVITHGGTLAGANQTVSVADVDLSGGASTVTAVETTAGVARAAGTAQVSGSDIVVVQIDYDADAAGDVTIHGSLEPAVSATNFDVLATDTAVASTTALVHLTDMPISALKVDSTALTAGLATITYSEWK